MYFVLMREAYCERRRVARKMGKRVLVIVPAYNEEESLEHTVKELEYCLAQQSRWIFDYVIVNDGSSDRTRDICAQTAIPCLIYRLTLA